MAKKTTKKKKQQERIVIRLGKRGNIDPREIRRAVLAVKKEREEKEKEEKGRTTNARTKKQKD